MGTLGLEFEKGLYLGIDFGTTNTVVSIYDYDEEAVYTLPIDGEMIFPTVIQFEEDYETEGKLSSVFGLEAKEAAMIYPESTIMSVKRLLSKDQSIEVVVGTSHYDFKSEDIVAQILTYIKVKVGEYLHEEKHLSGEFSGCVITVPANSTDKQKNKMRHAAIGAGFIEEHIYLRLEPAAAAINYAKIATKDSVILVYDFGGGTFDACLLKLFEVDKDEPEISILSTYGDNLLGGNDIDKIMMDIIYDTFLNTTNHKIDLFDFEKDDGVSKKQKKMALIRLNQIANQAKERLSTVQTTKIVLAPFLQEPELININIEVTREAFYNHKRQHRLGDDEGVFEAMKNLSVKDMVAKTIECVNRCLESSGVGVNGVDEIFLVGGSSAIPEVQEQIEAKFSKKPFKSKISPALSISQGAACYCNMIMLPSVRGPKVHETTVHPLGLEIAGRRFMEIISAGVLIPEEGLVVEAEELLYTNFDHITSMAIVVYEDTEPIVGEKHLKFVYEQGMKRLAGATLQGIPSAIKNEEKVKVVFKINRDNLLTITAMSTSTDGAVTELIVEALY